MKPLSRLLISILGILRLVLKLSAWGHKEALAGSSSFERITHTCYCVVDNLSTSIKFKVENDHFATLLLSNVQCSCARGIRLDTCQLSRAGTHSVELIKTC